MTGMQRHPIANVFRAAGAVSAAILLWMLAPMSLLVPRDRRRVIVVGRDEGKFVDNAKYAFLAAPAEFDVYFLSEQPATVARLREAGLRALQWPAVGAVWSCLRASAVVVDSAEWTRKGRLQCLWRVPVFQLWHGIPLKEIELDLFRRRIVRMDTLRRGMLRLYKRILGRYWTFEGVAVTSRDVGNRLFRSAFHAKRLLPYGYPRNDVLLRESTEMDLINVDREVLSRCWRYRADGGKVCLYAPTFRKHRQSAFDAGALSVDELDDFGRKRNILFVLKLHPLIENAFEFDLGNVVSCDPASDIYPLLPEVDILCTDYSSMFFDYLLLDRPQVFFAYDLDEYQQTDRALNMDYASAVPGPVCREWGELQQSITASLQFDSHAERRQHIRVAMFDHVDAKATERIWNAIREGLGADRE